MYYKNFTVLLNLIKGMHYESAKRQSKSPFFKSQRKPHYGCCNSCGSHDSSQIETVRIKVLVVVMVS